MKIPIWPLLLFLFFPISASFAQEENIIKTSIKNQKFIPNEIHIKVDQNITLRVFNEDSIPVEFESSDLNKEKMIQPGKTIDIPLKSLKAGTYEFFSDFGPKDLRGKIIVELK
jgi:heme/copper-type cytochrome/quinol oxidase subunit 2